MLIHPATNSDSVKKYCNLNDCIRIVVAPNEKDSENFSLFSKLISISLEKVLPDEFMKELLINPSHEKMRNMVSGLRKIQPLITWDDPSKAPCSIKMSLICAAEFTTGI